MTCDMNVSNEAIDDDQILRKAKNDISKKKYFSSTSIKDIITILSSILVPVVLGVFTILSTYNQWSMENNRNKQQSELEIERHQQQIAMNLDKYRNDLLVDYIEKMGTMMKESNFSLTTGKDLAALARAKTLSTISQLDATRIMQVIRFLYETGLIARVDQRKVLDVSKADLSGVPGEVFYTYAEHGRLALDGISINNTVFNNILLENVDFDSTKLININFSSTSDDYENAWWISQRTTIISHSQFKSAHLYKVEYAYAQLNSVVFDKAQLKNISFYGARLLEISFRETNLVNVTLNKAQLTNVSFHGARFLETSFLETSLDNVTLNKAQLTNVSFHGAGLLEISFPETNMSHVDFSFARLISVRFSAARMEYVNFTQAVLYHVVFSGDATMSDIIFDGPTFHNVTFEWTHLKNVRFVSVAFFSGSFINTELRSVNFSRSLRTSVLFFWCPMRDIDLSYSNLKRSKFQLGSDIGMQKLNFFRTNLQYASLDHGHFSDARISNTSYMHKAKVWGNIYHDPNLLSSSTSPCEKRIPDKWKVEFGEKDAVFSGDHMKKCRFSLKEGIKKASLTQHVSLSNIWERDIWPVSYGIISVFMSDDVLVELLGIDKNGLTSNSIVMSSNDITEHRMRLHKDMHHMVVNIHFTGHHQISNASNIWCDEPYLVIEYGTKQDLHPSLNDIPSNPKWSTKGEVIIEGLSTWPAGLAIDQQSGTVFVADYWNDRIVSWIPGQQIIHEVVNDLNWPTDVLVDKDNNSLIIADRDNRRVIRFSLQSNNTQIETIIDNIDCWGLAMDDEGALYVTDTTKSEVRRYPKGNKIYEIVAGRNGLGSALDQLNEPSDVTVDSQGAVYVSDYNNHRVVKWNRGATQGIVVAGFGSYGSGNTQLYYPRRVLIDVNDNLYIADENNNRIVRYRKNATTADIIVNQLNYPYALAFDNANNLYVSETNLVLRFNIIN